jgi:hypothetical protein
LISSRVPALEAFREAGVLWTKLVGVVHNKSGQPVTKDGRVVKDPSHSRRLHCIATAEPIFFETIDGIIDGPLLAGDRSMQIREIEAELTLHSDSPIHRLDTDPFAQMRLTEQLLADEYFKELPTLQTWTATTIDVNKICNGIATRFKQKSDEEKSELSHETFLQVATKMRRYKLVFTPGMAPVFNLLTTTIYRCMCSIMNRRKSQREGLHKLIKDAKDGTIRSAHRSLRAYSGVSQ